MRNFGQREEEFREQNLKNKYFLRPEKIVAFVFFCIYTIPILGKCIQLLIFNEEI